ncbi:MAG: phospholipase D-like domain-containing protein [Bryobacteraceae bacterium]|nr:phospholipase D-like domain-containing protein [Bryobacteraceae bacterium]
MSSSTVAPATTVQERLILEPAGRRAAILDLIHSARNHIALSMFRCTDIKVLDKLAEALERGVRVELLLTQRAKGWEKKIRELGLYLESMGARVHRYGVPEVKYHAKYVIADGERAIVASLNLTRKCFEETADFLLLTSDPEVCASLERLFDHDVSKPGRPLPGDLSQRLLVGPEFARQRFIELIGGARRCIRIVDHRLKDPEMQALLATRRVEGIAIEHFGKGDLDGLRSHGKTMLIDGERAVIGSISLSTRGLNSRRELAILLTDAALVAQLSEFLDRCRKPAAPEPAAPEAPETIQDDEDDEEDHL